MKKQVFKVLSAVLLGGVLISCREKAPDPAKYELGVLVLNEGNFSQGNGSISYFPREKNEAQYDIFQTANGRPLGGYIQGYGETGGHSLILLDNLPAGQDKVEIVQFGNFKTEATLKAPDIENPRDVVGVSPTKAYVSCWGITGSNPYLANPGYIAVIDLTTFKVIKKIPVQTGAEKMVKVGNEVYLGTAGFADNGAEGDLLTIIDATKDEVKSRISVGNNPSPQALDANGKLWVSTGKSIVRLNPVSKVIEANIKIGSDPRTSPSQFAITGDGKGFFYKNAYSDANYKEFGATYFFNITDTTIPANKPVINRLFTGLAVDPLQNLLYAGVTPSYAQSGYVVRYRPDGMVVDSIKVEIGPSGFFFK